MVRPSSPRQIKIIFTVAASTGSISRRVRQRGRSRLG
jgi:hypothetical protein